MAKYVGIDLGTTFSAAAFIDDSGRPKIIKDIKGSSIFPSCVALIKDELVVGERARRQWGHDPSNAAARFKRDMGTSATHKINDRSYTPTELSGIVLGKIKEIVEENAGEIEQAVVTIPANFAQEARDATIYAAKEAGLNVQFIINEPTAAALYYAYSSNGKLGGTYAVFDLGGGTFDISIIKVKGNDIDVISSNGISKLGGDDFDKALWNLIALKYKEEIGKEIDSQDFTLNDAEEEKKSLSKRKRTTIEIDGDLFDISRKELEEAISGYLSQIEMMCEATIEEARIELSEIDGVFLAGGSTRLPAIVELVKRTFNQEPIADHNVDEVVALGAALYAAYKSDGKNLTAIQKESVSKLNVTETSNMCFGTISVGYSEAKGIDVVENSILIQKGQTLPCRVTESYFTIRDNQTTIDCVITESRSAEKNPKFVKIIWKGSLEVPGNRPAGQEIQVSFEYDENQMMNASFLDVASGNTTNIEISLSSNKNKNDIDKFLAE
jgi:molecular chaperone DnaK